MTKTEILQVSKPILFNTPMTQAILDGRKTVTRQVVKPQPKNAHTVLGPSEEDDGTFELMCGGFNGVAFMDWIETVKMPYQPVDYLYVRETWAKQQGLYWHKAGLKLDDNGRAYGCVPPEKWRPSIHMPKEAARIFLRVTDVRVERLNDMDYMDAIYEGIEPQLGEDGYPDYNPIIDFIDLWDSTIPQKDRDKYGWEANPWVWIIGFERVKAQ